jgi:hypothetical protein
MEEDFEKIYLYLHNKQSKKLKRQERHAEKEREK